MASGPIVKYTFWAMVNDMLVFPFESANEDIHHAYQSLFKDHPKGRGWFGPFVDKHGEDQESGGTIADLSFESKT